MQALDSLWLWAKIAEPRKGGTVILEPVFEDSRWRGACGAGASRRSHACGPGGGNETAISPNPLMICVRFSLSLFPSWPSPPSSGSWNARGGL